MNIAYLIMAHRNPRLIQKLVDALSSPTSAFFLHIDAKARLQPFASITGSNIRFTAPRIPVYWAEYSMVEAILGLMREAVARHYDYYILLSGSDYPLRSGAYIREFLTRHWPSEFISLVEIPNHRAGIPLSRIDTRRIPSVRPVSRFVTRVLAKAGLAHRDHRKYLGDLAPYGGSTWWILTRDACQYVLDFANTRPSVCRFFAETFAPDESFFHTILGNSPFKANIRRNVMYDDWVNVGPHPAHPAAMGHEHVELFESSEEFLFEDVFGRGEMLFARKFSDDDLDVVRRVDGLIRRKGTAAK
jgi:Core-2/I-Branching enzyme